jgi:glutaredoxin
MPLLHRFPIQATLVVVSLLALASSCAPPSTTGAAAGAVGDPVDADAPALPVVRADATTLLFSFVDAAGRMQAVPGVNDVPDAVRRRVLVVDLAKSPEERQAHRYAFFADLTAPGADGTYPVVVVSRYDAATHKAGPTALPAPDGSVVVYSAVWCGYCKKAKAWLTRNQVPFIERDVEKTPGAQADLSAKLKASGVAGGGIPVIDWGGSLVVGFDVPSLERLLREQPAAPSTPTPPATPASAAAPSSPAVPPATNEVP